MPIYEYQCEGCGLFEVMQRITEEPLKTCEKCGRPVVKLVSQSSFALKGGGWYKDLYSSTSKSSGGGGSSSSGSSSSGSSSSGSSSSGSSSSGSSSSGSSSSGSSSSSAAKSESKPAAAAA